MTRCRFHQQGQKKPCCEFGAFLEHYVSDLPRYNLRLGLFGMRRVQILNGGEMRARLKDWK